MSEAPEGAEIPCSDSHHILRFGPFAFETSRSRLCRDGVEVHLTPKAAAVLLFLLQRPGELITKDEFLESVWDGVHVREESLTQAVSVIRQALGDSVQSPQYIQTVSGEGYRFIGDVRGVAADAPAVLERGIAGAASGRTLWVHRVAVVGFAAVGLLVVGAVVRFAGPASSASVERPPIRTLAVSPLEHLGTPERQYFTDAMSELLSTRLGKVGSLSIIPPTLLRRAGAPSPAGGAGSSAMSADALIGGSVLWDGDNVRVIVRLVDAISGEQLQAWEFTRAVRDVVTLQSQIATAIVDGIDVTPSPEERRLLAPSTPTTSFEALDHWAAGMAIATGRLGEGLDRAIEHFTAALDIDPDFADAQTGLGISYVQLGTYGLLAPDEAFPKAREAAQRAIDLDESSGKAQITLAWVNFVCERDYQSAAARFDRGIELSPYYFGAHHQLSWFQTARGRFDEAVASMERARRLDPASRVTHAQSAAPYYFRGDYASALVHARRARDMDPYFGNAYVQLGRIHLARGDADAATEAFERARELTPHPRLLGDLALAYGAAGRVADAQATLKELEAIAATEITYVEPLAFAWAWLGLDEHDRALRYLEQAIDVGGNPLPLLIEWDPKYDALRDDPRFTQLVDRVRALRE